MVDIDLDRGQSLYFWVPYRSCPISMITNGGLSIDRLPMGSSKIWPYFPSQNVPYSSHSPSDWLCTLPSADNFLTLWAKDTTLGRGKQFYMERGGRETIHNYFKIEMEIFQPGESVDKDVEDLEVVPVSMI